MVPFNHQHGVVPNGSRSPFKAAHWILEVDPSPLLSSFREDQIHQRAQVGDPNEVVSSCGCGSKPTKATDSLPHRFSSLRLARLAAAQGLGVQELQVHVLVNGLQGALVLHS